MWLPNEKAVIAINGKVIAIVPSKFVRKHERITRRRTLGNLVFAVYSLGFLDYYEWAHPTWHGMQIYFAFMGALFLLLGITSWKNATKITTNRMLLALHQHIMNEARKRDRTLKDKA